MKKVIIVLFICVFLFYVFKEKDYVYIPNENFRYRIIANSNSDIDQQIKMKINDEIYNNILINTSFESKEKAMSYIKNNNDNIKNIIEKYNVDYDISLGSNYFPTKTYKGIKYKDGFYDSLVISLGEAKGNNWWCILFPPLCNLEKDSNNYNEVTYKSFFKEIIKK